MSHPAPRLERPCAGQTSQWLEDDRKGQALTPPNNTRTPIHLTFDDGPDPVWTPRVLEALHRTRVRATFFVIAPEARRCPALIRAMTQAGHGVEFHCVEHVRHTDSPRAKIEADLREGLETLSTLGVHPRLWRPPWGVTALWTAALAEQFGLDLALWTADTHDWRGDSAGKMFDNIEDRLAPGAVVLMHDGLGPGALRSGCEETVALIPPLANRIRTLGYETAPLSPRNLPPLEARWRTSA